MNQKPLLAAIVVPLLITMVIGMFSAVLTPVPVSAEGNGGDPPAQLPTPPDTTYKTAEVVVNGAVANRALEQDISMWLVVEIAIRTILI